MQKNISVRIVEGRPWKDAIIAVLEPRTPYRPWHSAGDVEPGDNIIVVLDTDPVSVLTGVGVVGPDSDIHTAVAGVTAATGLLELTTVNMLTNLSISARADTLNPDWLAEEAVTTIGAYTLTDVAARYGHTALAAARVLLHSGGGCTACDRRLDLTGDNARDRVHIRTVAPGSGGRESTDWPAALCNSCHANLQSGGFTSFVDYLYSLRPRCPRCNAQHARSTMYGMPAGPVEEPWIATMGCCIIEPLANWACGDCDHEWS